MFWKWWIWIDGSHLKTRCLITTFTFNRFYWIWKVIPVKPNINLFDVPFSNILMIWSNRNWERLLNVFKTEFNIRIITNPNSVTAYISDGYCGKVVKLWKLHIIVGNLHMFVADSIYPKYWIAASGRQKTTNTAVNKCTTCYVKKINSRRKKFVFHTFWKKNKQKDVTLF